MGILHSLKKKRNIFINSYIFISYIEYKIRISSFTLKLALHYENMPM